MAVVHYLLSDGYPPWRLQDIKFRQLGGSLPLLDAGKDAVREEGVGPE
jgi:hypothetical protein